eukprot:472774-Pyramimonas_sp.AAC.1
MRKRAAEEAEEAEESGGDETRGAWGPQHMPQGPQHMPRRPAPRTQESEGRPAEAQACSEGGP